MRENICSKEYTNILVHTLANELETQDEYFTGPPFAQITALIRLGIESTSFWSAFTSREHHVLAMQLFRSCKLDGGGECCRMRLSTIPHTFSMGLRSGQCGGQERCRKTY